MNEYKQKTKLEKSKKDTTKYLPNTKSCLTPKMIMSKQWSIRFANRFETMSNKNFQTWLEK